MTSTLAISLIYNVLGAVQEGSEQQDGPKTDTTVTKKDSFSKSDQPVDFKRDIPRLFQGQIKSLDFEIKEDGFSLKTVLPKKSIRSGTSIELTVNGKKYTAEYHEKKPYLFPGEFQAGFYHEDRLVDYTKIDSLLSKGASVSMSQPKVPIVISIIEPRAYTGFVDVTGDNHGDVKHADLIELLIEGKAKKLGIPTSILAKPNVLVKTKADLQDFAGIDADVVILPYGTPFSFKEDASTEKYQETAATLRKYNGEAKLYSMLEDLAAEGVFVIASAGNKPREVSHLLPGKGIIGIGALASDGKIADYSAKNDFVDIHRNGTFNIDFVTDDEGEFKGLDVNNDGKQDIGFDGYPYLHDESDDLWHLLKGMLGQKVSQVTYGDKEVDELVAKAKDGYKMAVTDDKPFKKTVLSKEGEEAVELTKMFTKDQYNRLMEAMGQSIRATGDESRYFLFGKSIVILGVKDDRLVRKADKVKAYANGRQYFELTGTSFAPVDLAIDIAKANLHVLDMDASAKRAAIGVKD